MKRRLFLVTVLFCVAAVVLPDATRATPGIFQGKIYEPAHDKAPQGWIYVLGRNRMVRRVEISRATVVYADTVPSSERGERPTAALIDGTEVRVTAEQDKSGEWRASRVEIIKLGRSPARPAGDSARLR